MATACSAPCAAASARRWCGVPPLPHRPPLSCRRRWRTHLLLSSPPCCRAACVALRQAKFPTGPALSDKFWLYLITWHTGLFLTARCSCGRGSPPNSAAAAAAGAHAQGSIALIPSASCVRAQMLLGQVGVNGKKEGYW